MAQQNKEPFPRMFPLLTADDIELRVGTVGEKGVTLLLYKNARVDQNILDKTVGPMNWGRDHKELKGVMYCGVSIWDVEKCQWVTKWDAGIESNEQSQKGEASDSFKRACVNWGIGRELYTAPWIFLPVKTVEAGKKSNGKPTYELANRYELNNHHVKAIGYNESGSINYLVLADQTKNVWTMDNRDDKASPKEPPKEPTSNDKISPERVKWLRTTADGEERYQTRCNTILQDYGIEKIEDITNGMFERIVAKVKKGEL
jgi:hypothetical protein